MKYKVGDVVKVKENLVPGIYYGDIWFSSEMYELKGRSLTILSLHTDYYRVKEADFAFSDEMFEDDLYWKAVQEDKMNFKIVNYEVHDNDGVKTVVVTFEDGSKEHAVCHADDVFEMERAVEICVVKKVLGADTYRKMLKDAMKQIKAVDKAKEDKKKEEELIARKKAKNAKRKARHNANRRARRIEEMKQAYLAAMREHDCVVCEDFLDDAK